MSAVSGADSCPFVGVVTHLPMCRCRALPVQWLDSCRDWPAPEAGLYFFKMSEQIKIEKDLQVISRLAISQFARRNVAGEANPVGGLCPEPGHRQGRRLGEEEPVRYITFGEERTVAAIFAWEEDASQQ